MHEVIEEIIESNKWRDGEFAKFKVNSTNVDDTLWCRMCIPMIYAHWEGFVVSSIRLLLGHLNKLKLNPSDVKTNLVVVGLGESYKSLSGKQSFEQRIKFTDKFTGVFNKELKFDKKVDTKSNLNSKVFIDLCEMFTFESSSFKEYSGDIDRLVSVRNSIAHGENSIVVNMDNVNKYIEAVTKSMDILTSEIERFIKCEEYLMIKSA